MMAGQDLDYRTLTLGHLVDQAGLAYVEVDMSMGIRYWNRGAESLFGLSREDVLGRRLEQTLDVPAEVLNQLGSEEGACRTALSSPDRRVFCRIRFTPVIDASGVRTGVALLILESVDRSAGDACFSAGGQSMADVLGFAPIGIFHAGLDGCLVMANSEFAWMLGYETPDRAVAQVRNFTTQVFYDAPRAEEFMFILMEAERIARFRCRLKRRDNSVVWALCYAMLTRDATGRVSGFNGYAIDIGDTIRTETALEKANEELTRLSVIDGLTQIANRRQFDTRLEAEWQRYKNKGQPISVILCDIDHFKKFNDRYGHQTGDECLIMVARAIDACARQAGGMAARYGGEEFGVILPETAGTAASIAAESIRKKVLSLAIAHQAAGAGACVTLSLGVGAAVPGPGDSDTVLLADADRALYKAKEHGRNRVVAAEPCLTAVSQGSGGLPDKEPFPV